jgi:hypothetical protein
MAAMRADVPPKAGIVDRAKVFKAIERATAPVATFKEARIVGIHMMVPLEKDI